MIKKLKLRSILYIYNNMYMNIKRCMIFAICIMHSCYAISCSQSDAIDYTVLIETYMYSGYTSPIYYRSHIGAISSDLYMFGDVDNGANVNTIFARITFQNVVVWSFIYGYQSLERSFEIDTTENYVYSLEESASY